MRLKYRRRPVHDCGPNLHLPTDRQPGDIYQCECGRWWYVYVDSLGYHSDSAPPSKWYVSHFGLNEVRDGG